MTPKIARIHELFATEQAKPLVPRTAEDLPVSYNAITDEWLTAVLCSAVPGAQVVSHQITSSDSGTSNRGRISVAYNEAGKIAGLPENLFCKATHSLANRVLLSTSAIISEVTFYNEIQPNLDIAVPACFYARYDDQSYNSMIMLGDLTGQVTFCDHRTVITRVMVENQLKLLARLHAQYYESSAFSGRLQRLFFWPDRFKALNDNHDFKSACNTGIEASRPFIPERLAARSAETWEATLRSVESHRDLPRTLNHGDVHLKNWFILPGDLMGLGDWQVTSVGHWSRDVAYTITTALSVENRRAWEADLLRFYLDALQAEGCTAPDFEMAWLLYRQQMMSALAWWTMTLTPTADMPDMQPEDVTVEFIRRIATAIDDLDVLDSFG